MGAWGPGLYSDDYATDLKTTVSTVCRLPMNGPEILALLTDLESPASTPGDEDFTTFWLVVADQLHRRGIESGATTTALEIIASEQDLRLREELGMSERDISQRRVKLLELRRSLLRPLPKKTRRTLAKPQPLVVEPGEVYTFPVDSRGNPYNPYFTKPEQARFTPVGWSSCWIIRTGHAFDYLAWVQVAPDPAAAIERSELAAVVSRIVPTSNGVGTLSKAHKDRMRFEMLGSADPPSTTPPEHSRIVQTVASDIGACNLLSKYWPPGTLSA